MSETAAYAAILLLSLFVAVLLRYASIPLEIRPPLTALAGAAVALACCGHQVVHALLPSALVLATLRLAPTRVHGGCGAGIAIAYLAFARSLHLSGVTNALMLILTLRLIAVSFDSQDGSLAASRAGSGRLVQYLCHFHGLATGPFYTVDEWWRATRLAPASPPPATVRNALLAAAVAAVVWRGVAALVPFDAVRAADFDAAGPLGYRCAYVFVSSFQYRYRFYTCWLLMEAAGLLAGYDKASNVDMLTCELASCPSELIGAWNTSVQRFLKLCVYRRLPLRQRTARQLGTFAFSAFWHGIHPGYYLFFAGIAATLFVEQAVCRPTAARLRRSGWPLERGVVSFAGRMAACAWTMGCFTWFGQAFNLKHPSEIWHVWSSLHHVGFALLLTPVLLSILGLGVDLMMRRATGLSASNTRAKEA